jgi:hypothetical protein
MKTSFLLVIALVLSGFTHLWNAAGYPIPDVDEGIYLGNAVMFMDTLNPKDPFIGYFHPYFGQIFLAGVLYIVGYQNLLTESYMNPEILLQNPKDSNGSSGGSGYVSHI